jgi:16S rRNA (adenine1518-N6/adenine1519-N6)-dimethyltransferase
MMTLTRSEVTGLLQDHGLHPSRALGQNFVVDPNTVRRIARLAELGTGDRVLEIGAGVGSLTLALAETGAHVTAVEVDRYLMPVLRAVVAGRDVTVVEGDALQLSWEDLLEVDRSLDGATTSTLVANLPYNVAVPLVVRVLEEASSVHRMLVMVQREVGERLAAGPGGRASVKVAYYARASVVGRVPATVFYPRPRVESVLVRMDRRSEVAVPPQVVGSDQLFAVVRAGFAHRRKMLRRALASVATPSVFATASVSPQARAEELSVEDWGRLAAAVEADGSSERKAEVGPGGDEGLDGDGRSDEGGVRSDEGDRP